MPDAPRGPLRILITNNTLDGRNGSELYVRDLALEYMKRGQLPVAYSPFLGEVAEELRANSIPVLADLDEMEAEPDIIHGHHHHESMTAALRYPRTPMIFVCHGWAPWEETPPLHPNIVRYVAVDDLCRERLLTTRGIAPERTATIYNFADLQRFLPRPPLPPKPRTALVFSNYAARIPLAIQEACERAGIDRLDIRGYSSGNLATAPEEILGQYDIVFAKARAAIEALASGCAVILADTDGVGGMVTTTNMHDLRRLNFGLRTLKADAMSHGVIEREIGRYDASDAKAVSDEMRAVAGLQTAADTWIDLYRQVVAEWNALADRNDDAARMRAGSRYLRQIAMPLKSRRDAELMLAEATRREAVTRADLETLVRREPLHASRQLEIDRLTAALSASEADLARIRGSRAWKLIGRYRRFRQWLTRR